MPPSQGLTTFPDVRDQTCKVLSALSWVSPCRLRVDWILHCKLYIQTQRPWKWDFLLLWVRDWSLGHIPAISKPFWATIKTTCICRLQSLTPINLRSNQFIPFVVRNKSVKLISFPDCSFGGRGRDSGSDRPILNQLMRMSSLGLRFLCTDGDPPCS